MNNTTALTAKHCVTNFNPSYPKTLRTKMEGSLVLGVTSIISSNNYDIAMLFLDKPYPMLNRSTGKVETEGYTRPADWRWAPQMHGSVMKCAGIGGSRVVTSDVFSVCGYNDDPTNKNDWFAVSEIGGASGGQIVHGDSGAPCLYVDGSTKYTDRLPLSGINSGIGPSVTAYTYNSCPPSHRLAQIVPWVTAFFYWN